jgi:hypothetical protein
MFIHLVLYLSKIRERGTYWLTILSFSLIPASAAAGPDMETWIAFSLNNSRAELSISKQKDRKTEREGGKRGREEEREGGRELEIAWKWGRKKREDRKELKWNKLEETHVIAVVTFVSIPLSDWLAQAAVSLK